jgi:hypothetical protein
MSLHLTNRSRQVPGGFRFQCHATGYKSPPFASFNVICNGVRAARLANPALVKQHNLPTDLGAIEAEVDYVNALYCKEHNYTTFFSGTEDSPRRPFTAHPLNQRGHPQNSPNALKSVAAGSAALVEWIATGAEAVPRDQANARAKVCSECPFNEAGDWTRFFVAPVSEAIRVQLNLRRQWALTTDYDDKLNICSGCLCPMKLKVHVPLDKFYPKMSEATRGNLHWTCWILKEAKAESPAA